MFNYFIFDADGTLFDYDRAEFFALKNTFKTFRLTFSEEYLAYYREFNKVLWDRFEEGKVTIPRLQTERFELLLKRLNKDVNPRLFGSAYLDQLSLQNDLIDGAEELLSELFKTNTLVLMTNGIKEVQRSRLNLSPLKKYFSEIIISDEVGVAKPDKKIFEIAHKRMSYPEKNSILMVGDNMSSDIKGGNAFGISTCWFNPHFKKADNHISATYEIRHLKEILSLIK